MPVLSAADREVVQKALAVLPGRTKVAQEKEVGDMMGKLKEVSREPYYIDFCHED
jgi:hypothetical protein